MKKILLGCGVIALLVLAVPAFIIGKYRFIYELRQDDCKAVKPTVAMLYEVTGPFYMAVAKQAETRALALQTAAKVEAQLPKLTVLRVKDTELKHYNTMAIESLKLFVGDARDWAADKQAGSYLAFISKRTAERPQVFRSNVPASSQLTAITDYCYGYY